MRKIIVFGLGLAVITALAWSWFRRDSPIPPDAATLEPPRDEAPTAVDPAGPSGEEPRDETPPDATRRVPVAPDVRCQLRLRVIEAESANPIDGVTCGLGPGDGRKTISFAELGTTDRAGEILVRDLSPGQYGARVVGSDQTTWIEVQPGQENHAVLEVSAALEITGRVVDGSGAELANAQLWLTGRRLADREQLMATSDHAGQFRFETRGLDRLLTARLTGVGCSLSVPLNQPALESGHVVLVVDQAVSVVLGTVTGPDGNPVSGARVAIGKVKQDPQQAVMMAPYGRVQKPRLPVEVATDGAGHFETSAAPIGDRVPVFIRAPGLAPWQGEVRLQPLTTVRVDAQLQAGATIEGVVRDRDHAACRDVIVSVNARHREPPWLATEAISSANGSYVLSGLAAGRLRAQARDHPRGSAEEHLQVQAGETLTWNPTLDPGATIAGRVVDESGKPLRNWRVEAADKTRRRGQATTDANGAFQIIHCNEQPHVLTAHQHGAWMPTRVATVGDILPDGDPVEIRVQTADLASTFITGEIVGADGEARRCVASIRLETESFSQQMGMALKPGPFSLGPLLPGRYRVDFTVHGHDRLSVAPFSLAADETHHLGLRRATAMGELLVRVLAADGSAIATGDVYLQDLDGRRAAQGTVENGLARIEVRPGPYHATIWAPGHAFSREPVLVPAGGSTEVATRLETGVECSFRLVGDHPSHLGTARLRWQTSTGVFSRQRLRLGAGDTAACEFGRTLPPGRYTLHVTTLRHAADAEFTVEAGAGSLQFDLQVRPMTQEERVKRLGW